MLAAGCILEALRGDAGSPHAIVGALILNDAAQWLIRIGRGLAGG